MNAHLPGSFVGNFGDNKITLLITKATNDSVAGRSIVGGNDRRFSGTLKRLKDVYTISLKEPGDEQHDGIFARHGHCFKMKILRGNFENKEWYISNTIVVKKELTDIEIKNITLIKKV